MNPLESFSDEELSKELNRRYKARQARELADLKASIGFDIKKLAVRYQLSDYRDDCDFSFFLKHEERYYCIYYDKYISVPEGLKIRDFWPLYESDCALHLYIPDGFAEECENVYSFNGTLDSALAALKEAGMEDVHPGSDEEYARWRGQSFDDGGLES